MYSTPEFVAAEVRYRQERVRAAWRAGARPRRVRKPRAGAPQPR